LTSQKITGILLLLLASNKCFEVGAAGGSFLAVGLLVASLISFREC